MSVSALNSTAYDRHWGQQTCGVEIDLLPISCCCAFGAKSYKFKVTASKSAQRQKAVQCEKLFHEVCHRGSVSRMIAVLVN